MKLAAKKSSCPASRTPEPWQKTDRWDIEKMDVWFRTQLAAGGELGLAPTHEEPMTNMLKSYISGYKDLPIYVYQFPDQVQKRTPRQVRHYAHARVLDERPV